MKVEVKEKTFHPITITLESFIELSSLLNVLERQDYYRSDYDILLELTKKLRLIHKSNW